MADENPNTDPRFLEDPTTPQHDPVLEGGIDVSLQDLTGYSANMNQVQMNFSHLSEATSRNLNDMVTAAFGEMTPSLEWTYYMNRLASHNAMALDAFYRGIATGVMNVAMAAQVVANVYADQDATNAANLKAVEFAFGDKSAAPDYLPKSFVDKLPTYESALAEQQANGGAPEDGSGGVPVFNYTDGNNQVQVSALPGGHTMQTITNTWTTYPGGPSGKTVTVMYDGKVQSVTTTTTVGSTTTTSRTRSYYNEAGERTAQRVVEETTETYSAQGENLQKDTRTTRYDYDPTGQNLEDQSTIGTTTSVGVDPSESPLLTPEDDPAFQEQERLRGN